MPWPAWLAPGRINGVAGDMRRLFVLPNGTTLAMLICWENLFGDLVRGAVKDGAQTRRPAHERQRVRPDRGTPPAQPRVHPPGRREPGAGCDRLEHRAVGGCRSVGPSPGGGAEALRRGRDPPRARLRPRRRDPGRHAPPPSPDRANGPAAEEDHASADRLRRPLLRRSGPDDRLQGVERRRDALSGAPGPPDLGRSQSRGPRHQGGARPRAVRGELSVPGPAGAARLLRARPRRPGVPGSSPASR